MRRLKSKEAPARQPDLETAVATPDAESEAQQFAVAAARLATEHKTDDVVVLDLRGLSGFADFFVIGTGTSERQMHAVADRIEEHARATGRKPYRVSDSREAAWILADYVDVVIHLFDAEHREYYDLEALWGDAPRIAWQAPPHLVTARPKRGAKAT